MILANHWDPILKIFQISQEAATKARKGPPIKVAHIPVLPLPEAKRSVSLALVMRIFKIIIREWISHQEEWKALVLKLAVRQEVQLAVPQQNRQEIWLVLLPVLEPVQEPGLVLALEPVQQLAPEPVQQLAQQPGQQPVVHQAARRQGLP